MLVHLDGSIESWSARSQGEATPRTRDAQATQSRLLSEAELEFAAHGYQGARLRSIAGRAGVQPALIHHYFGDKRGLYQAMLVRGLSESNMQSTIILEADQHLPIVVDRFVSLLLRFNRKHDKLITILRREALAGSPAMDLTHEVLHRETLPVIAAVKRYIRQQQDQGAVRADIGPADVLMTALPLCSYPFLERGFLETCLPEGLIDDEAAMGRRQRAIVDALLRYLRPES
jgi:TetR/AcrR family transcriptional regulator